MSSGPYSSLTPRQLELLEYFAANPTATNGDAGKHFVISHRTVGQHLQNVYDTLGVTTRQEALQILAGEHASPHVSLFDSVLASTSIKWIAVTDNEGHLLSERGHFPLLRSNAADESSYVRQEMLGIVQKVLNKDKDWSRFGQGHILRTVYDFERGAAFCFRLPGGTYLLAFTATQPEDDAADRALRSLVNTIAEREGMPEVWAGVPPFLNQSSEATPVRLVRRLS